MMGLLEMWSQSKEIIHGRVGIVGWRRRVEVITTGQLHSTKSEPMYCAGSNSACGVSEICNGDICPGCK